MARARQNYLEQSRRPLYALLFLAPLIIAYEIGVWFEQRELLAGRMLSDFVGLFTPRGRTVNFLSGLFVLGVLIGRQIASNQDWKARPAVLGVMALEALALTLPLFLLHAMLPARLSRPPAGEAPPSTNAEYRCRPSSTVRDHDGAGLCTPLPLEGEGQGRGGQVEPPGSPVRCRTCRDAVARADLHRAQSPSPRLARVCDPSEPTLSREGERVVAAALGLCLPAFAEPTLFAARPSTFVGAEPSAGNNADASPPAPRSADDGSRAARLRRDIIISLGAGPYEELIFRLFLVEFLLWFMTGLLKVDRQAAVVTAVLLSATLFAGYHYLPGTGERFNWGSFLFRTGAGIYFSIIFVVRGYGLAAGCHTFYDVLVDLARG